jgi:hypothetical protein
MHLVEVKMRKLVILSILGLIAILGLASVFVFAMPNTNRVVATNNNAGVAVIIPEHAVQVADHVFSLGEAVDPQTGELVEGYMIITDKRKNAKPGTECGNGICEAGENAKKCSADCGGGSSGGDSTCYSTYGKGVRWKVTEDYHTDLDVDAALVATSLETWDSEVAYNIFGNGIVGGVDGFDDVSPDGKNEVEWVDMGNTSTLAFTIVWGVFGGPPFARGIVEWDTAFNSFHPYGDAVVNPLVFDYEGVAAHEFGHALGLDHSPGTCTEETMFASASLGEYKKRTLEAGDIAGVNKVYA